VKYQLNGLKAIAMAIAVLWIIELINVFSGRALNQFGLLPRSVEHLYGVVTFPILHQNVWHLIGNSLPLAVLAFLVHQTKHLFASTVIIILVSGVTVWFIGRDAYHIGASGLVLGYWGFLIAHGIRHRSFKTIALSVITVIFYGGLVFSLLDFRYFISFEGHIAGFLSGLLAAWMLPDKSNSTKYTDVN